jgi:hypothetical protein
MKDGNKHWFTRIPCLDPLVTYTLPIVYIIIQQPISRPRTENLHRLLDSSLPGVEHGTW